MNRAKRHASENNAFCSTHYKPVTKAPYFDTTRCTDFGVNLKQKKKNTTNRSATLKQR